jgi:uncharacterized membrane protein
VGSYWLQHYVIFHYLARADRILLALNGVFLLGVSFLPFPTGLMAAYREDELAVVIFGAVNIFCGLALLALWIYSVRGSRLTLPGIADKVVQGITWRLAIAPAVALVAIGITFLDLWAGKLLFLAIPACYVSHRLVGQRRT